MTEGAVVVELGNMNITVDEETGEIISLKDESEAIALLPIIILRLADAQQQEKAWSQYVGMLKRSILRYQTDKRFQTAEGLVSSIRVQRRERVNVVGVLEYWEEKASREELEALLHFVSAFRKPTPADAPGTEAEEAVRTSLELYCETTVSNPFVVLETSRRDAPRT